MPSNMNEKAALYQLLPAKSCKQGARIRAHTANVLELEQLIRTTMRLLCAISTGTMIMRVERTVKNI